jgi:hypothetical protein
MDDEFICIGRATESQEAPDKVTGRVVYAGDVYLPLISTIRQRQGKLMISDGKQHIMVRNRILS